MKPTQPRNSIPFLYLALALSFFDAHANPDEDASAAAVAFERNIRQLASDEMEGRGLGTQGITRAADWIENELRTIGLAPVFDDSYRQPFEVKTGVSMQGENTIEGLPFPHGIADFAFAVIDYRVARRFLVAGIAQGIQCQRILIGRGLLFSIRHARTRAWIGLSSSMDIMDS